jgi:hypothetical protein
MAEPPTTHQPCTAPHALSYQQPATPVPPTPKTIAQRRIVIVMACIWPLVMGYAGAFSDFTSIPLVKKIVLSATGVIVAILLIATRADRRRFGCAGWFTLLALWMTAAMWVLN